jgi:hypothetical protein
MAKSDRNGVAELAEDNFTFDVPDDALERSASLADGKITNLGLLHAGLVHLRLAALTSDGKR